MWWSLPLRVSNIEYLPIKHARNPLQRLFIKFDCTCEVYPIGKIDILHSEWGGIRYVFLKTLVCSRHKFGGLHVVRDPHFVHHCRGQLKCDGTRAETRFRLSAKRTSPFKSAGASVQSTTGSRGVRISGDNAGYTMFRGSVKGTGYPLHSPVFPLLPLPCVTVCHHVSAGLYVPLPRYAQDI